MRINPVTGKVYKKCVRAEQPFPTIFTFELRNGFAIIQQVNRDGTRRDMIRVRPEDAQSVCYRSNGEGELDTYRAI